MATVRPTAHPARATAMLAVGFVLVAVLGGVVVKRVAAGITPAGVLGLAAGIAGIWLVAYAASRRLAAAGMTSVASCVPTTI